MAPLTDRRRQTIAAATLLARAYRRHANRVLERLGLSDAMAWPLLIARQRDGLRQTELAQALRVEGPSLARTLDRLEASGLIERREDPQDRRAKTLHLSAAGERLCDDIEQAVTELARTAFGAVNEADLDACLRVFAQVEEALARQPAEDIA